MEREGAPGRLWAEIDLEAIRRNVRTLRRRAAGARLMAVVKADAYGHGALPVARAALEAGADSLAVATLAEGAELRGGGVRAPVLVFGNLLPGELKEAGRLRLEVTVHSLAGARLVASLPGLRAHLEVDTGMNRWGVGPEEAGEARRVLGERLVGVYTHLSCADSDPEFTREQLRRFDRVLGAHPFGGVLVHAANSAGTLWYPQARYDRVRPGVALYGLHPRGDAGDPADEDLRPALTLKSYVAGIRRLRAGECVSYGATFRAERTMWVATVPVGYADGYRRALSGRGVALIRGRRRRLLGRVTMDACVFEADGGVEVGDEVVLLGEQGEERVGAEELGRLGGTINYEVTTGLNPRRVERRYVSGV
ncbi:alanine racemase [Rubrobacter naiadicus]|uniref:alanine racemase n=1 Tax=Rubrobacter naiadicus TaxID=1392641 RepID=UPI00235DD70D|nr:alanine racemase [Rubrobacter naiadicus]